MKCQVCPKIATYHITEVLPEDRYEEHHLCEECAKQHLSSTATSASTVKVGSAAEDVVDIGAKHCDACGIKFVEFRNTGRLGCPHDYDSFHDELVPLLENIHGDTQHAGKTPKRLPSVKSTQHELAAVRRKLQTAIMKEQYEEAATLRDTLKKLEAE